MYFLQQCLGCSKCPTRLLVNLIVVALLPVLLSKAGCFINLFPNCFTLAYRNNTDCFILMLYAASMWYCLFILIVSLLITFFTLFIAFLTFFYIQIQVISNRRHLMSVLLWMSLSFSKLTPWLLSPLKCSLGVAHVEINSLFLVIVAKWSEY